MWRIRTLITGATGGPWLNTTCWDDSLGNRVEDASNNVYEFWNALRFRMVTGLTIQVDPTVDVIDTSTGHITSQVNSPVSPISTGSTTDPLPWATQAEIYLPTAVFVAGRKVAGKLYVPGLCHSSLDSGVLSSAAQTDIQNAINAVYDGGTGLSTPHMRIWSRKHLADYDVSAPVVRQQFAVLRSRRDS